MSKVMTQALQAWQELLGEARVDTMQHLDDPPPSG